MLHSTVFLFKISMCSFLCSLVVPAKLFADCTFEEVKSWQSAHNASAVPIQLNGQLPYSKNVIHSCLVQTDNRNSLLYLRANRNKESKGSLHVSVYGEDESSLGHLDILQSSFDQSGLPVCPYRSSNEVNENHLTFSGTPGLNFTLEIAQVEDVKLGETRPFTLSSRDPVRVFKFVPTEDISGTQLDVTVTSESADVPAYLKVSLVCKDVEKDNIDEVDYKGESIRLSFAKKGRITLSKVSVPALTDSTSSWFIGIAIKNATGETQLDATKTVNLTLTRSFDYSYSEPLCTLTLGISVLAGLFVSLWAWVSFRECRCSRSQCTASEETEPLDGKKEQVSGVEFFSAMWDVISSYSFGRGPKTYSYITFIVGSVLMVGAFQFVFANWYVMIHEGDRDNCYYNDFCYRVRYFDIPYNLIISNLAYVLHGLILVVNVWCMESELLVRCRKRAKREGAQQNQNLESRAEEHKEKYTFTIGYAFGWALTFEGLFSSLYHLCPSKLTFQFDTAFMFVIASLIVVLLYNGIDNQEHSGNESPKKPSSGNQSQKKQSSGDQSPKKQSSGDQSPKKQSSGDQSPKNQVAAANLLLYFLVPLFIFNYLGTIHHSEAGLVMFIDIPFLLLLALWVMSMAWWAGCKLFPERCCCTREKEESGNEPGRNEGQKKLEEKKAKLSCLFYCLGLLVLILFVVLLATKFTDFPQTFLFTCISETLIITLGKLVVATLDPSCRKCKCTGKCTSQVFYVLATMVVGIAALVFFIDKQTTDKAKTPEQSRNLNEECYVFDFFDSHDIWHILSSCALLMSALLALHTHDPNACGNGTEAQGKAGSNDGKPEAQCNTDSNTEETETQGNTGSNAGKKGRTRKTKTEGEKDSIKLIEVRS